MRRLPGEKRQMTHVVFSVAGWDDQRDVTPYAPLHTAEGYDTVFKCYFTGFQGWEASSNRRQSLASFAEKSGAGHRIFFKVVRLPIEESGEAEVPQPGPGTELHRDKANATYIFVVKLWTNFIVHFCV